MWTPAFVRRDAPGLTGGYFLRLLAAYFWMDVGHQPPCHSLFDHAVTRPTLGDGVPAVGNGSERGKTKLHAPEGAKGFIGCLSAGEIGLAFGRERAIHAALAAGGLRSRVVEEAAKLAGLRGQTGGDDGGETAMKDT